MLPSEVNKERQRRKTPTKVIRGAMQNIPDSRAWTERPMPSDFGLDEPEIECLKEEERERQVINVPIEEKQLKIILWGMGIGSLLGLFYGFEEGAFGSEPSFVAGVFAAFVGIFLGWIIGGVTSLVYIFQSSKSENERHKLVTKYEAALELYVIAEAKRKEKYWKSLRGKELETELAMLLRSMGVPALLTPSSGDEGIDIDVQKDGERVIIQCKGHAKPVGSPAVLHLVGALKHSGADRAILAAPNGFTTPAREVAKKNGIELWSALDILTLKWKSDEQVVKKASPFKESLGKFRAATILMGEFPNSGVGTIKQGYSELKRLINRGLELSSKVSGAELDEIHSDLDMAYLEYCEGWRYVLKAIDTSNAQLSEAYIDQSYPLLHLWKLFTKENADLISEID